MAGMKERTGWYSAQNAVMVVLCQTRRLLHTKSKNPGRAREKTRLPAGPDPTEMYLVSPKTSVYGSQADPNEQ